MYPSKPRSFFLRRVLPYGLAVFVLGVGVFLWIFLPDEPPPFDEDLRLVGRSTPPEGNGFLVVERAAETVYGAYFDIEFDPQGVDYDPEAVREFVEKNEKLVDTLKEALELPDFLVPQPEGFDDELTYLNAWYCLADLLEARAGSRLEAGKDRQAFEDAGLLIRLGRRIQEGQGPVLPYLFGAGLQRRGLATLTRCLWQSGLPMDERLRLAAPLIGNDTDQEAFADAVRAEYGAFERKLEQLMRGEIFETADERRAFRVLSVIRPFVLKPNQTRRVASEYYREVIALGERGTIEECDVRPGSVWRGVDLNDIPVTNSAGRLFLLMERRFAPLAAVGKAELDVAIRGVRTVVAVKAFEVAQGRLPRSLEELVPEYLGEAPLDPFSGNSLRYSAEKRCVYSIGEDLLDQGGSGEEDVVGASWDSDEPTFRLLP